VLPFALVLPPLVMLQRTGHPPDQPPTCRSGVKRVKDEFNLSSRRSSWRTRAACVMLRQGVG
jgi:hypothetical protein